MTPVLEGNSRSDLESDGWCGRNVRHGLAEAGNLSVGLKIVEDSAQNEAKGWIISLEWQISKEYQ